MATHGGFGVFEDWREEWASYTERLEEYFTANDIKPAELPNYSPSHDPREADE